MFPGACRMLIVRLFLARKRDSTTQTPRPAIILRAFWGQRHANTAAVGAKCSNLSQLSHGLTGRYGTVAHLPDNRQDADLRIRILAHRPDGRHWSTDL